MTDDEILDRVRRGDGSIDHLEGALLGLAACGDMEEGEERRGLRSGAIANILVDIAQSLRRLNEGRDQWYREVLDLLSQAKDPGGSLRSNQPAAGPGCPICERPFSNGPCPNGAPLTGAQWLKHRYASYLSARQGDVPEDHASQLAEASMLQRFGPRPEES